MNYMKTQPSNMNTPRRKPSVDVNSKPKGYKIEQSSSRQSKILDQVNYDVKNVSKLVPQTEKTIILSFNNMTLAQKKQYFLKLKFKRNLHSQQLKEQLAFLETLEQSQKRNKAYAELQRKLLNQQKRKKFQEMIKVTTQKIQESNSLISYLQEKLELFRKQSIQFLRMQNSCQQEFFILLKKLYDQGQKQAQQKNQLSRVRKERKYTTKRKQPVIPKRSKQCLVINYQEYDYHITLSDYLRRIQLLKQEVCQSQWQLDHYKSLLRAIKHKHEQRDYTSWIAKMIKKSREQLKEKRNAIIKFAQSYVKCFAREHTEDLVIKYKRQMQEAASEMKEDQAIERLNQEVNSMSLSQKQIRLVLIQDKNKELNQEQILDSKQQSQSQDQANKHSQS